MDLDTPQPSSSRDLAQVQKVQKIIWKQESFSFPQYSKMAKLSARSGSSDGTSRMQQEGMKPVTSEAWENSRQIKPYNELKTEVYSRAMRYCFCEERGVRATSFEIFTGFSIFLRINK